VAQNQNQDNPNLKLNINNIMAEDHDEMIDSSIRVSQIKV